MPVCAQTDTPPRSANIDTARRVLNLLFIFNAAVASIPTSQIISDSDLGYGGANRESEFKKFSRDRERLEKLGFVIREYKPEGELETVESRWALDREASHIDTSSLEPDDADTLARAIDEYLGRADVPFHEPLLRIRAALVTVTGEMEASGNAAGAAAATSATGKTLDTLWSAYSARKQLKFAYTDAHGNPTTRTVNIYGFLPQQNSCYFVGFDDQSGEVRTFRADRVAKTWVPKKHYEVPADFDIKPYLFLPLDLGGNGESIVDAVFSFPASSTRDELLCITNDRGELEHQADGSWTWSIQQVDANAAARMALGYASRGMRPQAPAALIDQWHKIIDEAVCNHAA